MTKWTEHDLHSAWKKNGSVRASFLRLLPITLSLHVRERGATLFHVCSLHCVQGCAVYSCLLVRA